MFRHSWCDGRTSIFLAAVVVVHLFTAVGRNGAIAQDLKWEWKTEDRSLLKVTLRGGGDEFEWKNPDGSSVRFKTGTEPGERMISFDDEKRKGGTFVFPLGALGALLSANYGLNGEQAIANTSGLILEGNGDFALTAMGGFEGFDDFSANFSATLVAQGMDNPLHLSLFGQGDQLRFPMPGSVEYITKWASSDVIQLSNGEEIVIGNFYLVSSSQANPFFYNVTPDGTFFGQFTISEKYQFVNNLSLPPEGTNLRFELDGSQVTKVVQGGVIPPGDMNGDGLTDGFDIDPFVFFLSQGAAAYQQQFPEHPSPLGRADINNDGVADGFDIDPFVQILTGTGVSARELQALGIPEPATATLLAVALFGIGLARCRLVRR